MWRIRNTVPSSFTLFIQKQGEFSLWWIYLNTVLSLTASRLVPKLFGVDHSWLCVSILFGTSTVLTFPLPIPNVKYISKKCTPLPSALLPLKEQKLLYHSCK